jgi:integrase
MPKVLLTDVTVRALKPPPRGQVTYWDKTFPTFGLRCSQGGAKTWVLMRDNRRITIGRYPTYSLKKARAAADQHLAKQTLGLTPAPSTPFDDALDLYLRHHEAHKKSSTHAETRHLIEKHFKPAFGGKQLGEITKRDVSRILDGLLATPSEARHAFNAIRAFLRWAAANGHVDLSPLQNYPSAPKPASRARVLSPSDLKKVWNCAIAVGYPYGTIIRLLILTGQRRGEIAALQRAWINKSERTISLPAAITKNNTSHTFPYGPRAAAILSGIQGESDLLFPARGKPDMPINRWAKSKRAFDKRCRIDPWTLHDLRRTFSTINAQISTPPHVTEAILNHLSGVSSEIQRIYDRHNYMPEMRTAIERYEAHLKEIFSAVTPVDAPTRRDRQRPVAGRDTARQVAT